MKKSLHTDNAPAAVGPYSQAIQHGSTLYLSGQIALDPSVQKLIEGTVSDEVDQIMKNIEAVLTNAGLTFDNILKSTIYLTEMSDFSEVNKAYSKYLKEPYPAREAITVKELPLNATVEISVTAGY